MGLPRQPVAERIHFSLGRARRLSYRRRRRQVPVTNRIIAAKRLFEKQLMAAVPFLNGVRPSSGAGV